MARIAINNIEMGEGDHGTTTFAESVPSNYDGGCSLLEVMAGNWASHVSKMNFVGCSIGKFQPSNQ